MKWRRAGKRDLADLLALLLPQEWRAVPLTSRLLRQGKPALPTRMEASLLVCQGPSRIEAVMLLTSGGLLLPVFAQSGELTPPGPFPGWNELERLLYSVMGPAAEVAWLESALPLKPGASIDYHLMVLNRETFSSPDRESFPSHPGLVLRSACPEDLQELLPLQIRYELEEVVVKRERFSEQTCRQNLKRTLGRQLVLLAELNGQVVAKAGTNARGLGVDQIGGVYTEQFLRNSGIASWLINELLIRIFSKKEMACLFAKKSNLPALALYGKLGFRTVDGYRISYFKV